MQVSLTHENRNYNVVAYSIEEAKKKKIIAGDEAIGYHVWLKGVAQHVDERHFVYIQNGFSDLIMCALLEKKPEKRDLIEIGKEYLFD